MPRARQALDAVRPGALGNDAASLTATAASGGDEPSAAEALKGALTSAISSAPIGEPLSLAPAPMPPPPSLPAPTGVATALGLEAGAARVSALPVLLGQPLETSVENDSSTMPQRTVADFSAQLFAVMEAEMRPGEDMDVASLIGDPRSTRPFPSSSSTQPQGDA